MTRTNHVPARPGRGQALLEFALAAPIFFFLMFGLIELGRAVYYTQILDSAARDGARYGVVHGFESFCPSGPMRTPGNVCDPTGARNLIPAVKARAIGVTDKTTDLIVHAKWCDAAAYQATPPVSQCSDSLPCSQWATGTDPSGTGLTPPAPGMGDAYNDRGQIVTVCVQYSYKSLLAGYLPIPDFTVSGRSSLVVNN